MTAWKAAGVTLAHFTGDQWNESHAISKSELRVGDLVFYNGGNHVALYIGNGFVAQAEHTGEPLKESVLNFEPVVSNGYRRGQDARHFFSPRNPRPRKGAPP